MKLKERLRVDYKKSKEFVRLKEIEYKVRYTDLKTQRSIIIDIRRPYGYDISKENLLETLAAMICAGCSDLDNYREFYEGVTDYRYSVRDYNNHIEVYKKASKFFSYKDEEGNDCDDNLRYFVGNYYDWLEEEDYGDDWYRR